MTRFHLQPYMPMSRFFSSSYFFPGKLWFQLPKGFFLFLELCWLFRWCLAKPNLMFLSVTSAPYCNSSVFPFMIHVVIGDFGTGTTFRTFGAAVQFIPFYDCRLLILPLLMFFSVIIYCLVFFVVVVFFQSKWPHSLAALCLLKSYWEFQSTTNKLRLDI